MSHTFCAECGGKVDEGAAFCGTCGHVAAAPNAGHGDPTVPGGGGAAPAPEGHERTPEPDPTATIMAAHGPQPTPPYGASAYPPPAPAPPAYEQVPAKKSGGANRILLGVVSAAVVVAGFFGVNYLMGQKDDSATPRAAASPTASTAPSSLASAGEPGATTEPTPFTPPPAVPQAAEPPSTVAAENVPPVDERYQLYRRGSGFTGRYARAGALTERTSAPFMYSVAEAYASSGADGDSVVLTGVYSSVTEKSYRMTCEAQSDDTVACSGGVGAKVLLFN